MRIIIRNDYFNTLKSVKGTPDIKVITGIRRSGKSVILRSFINYIKKIDKRANIIFIDFSLVKNETLLEYHKLVDYVESKYIKTKNNYIFIDEVQMCKGFEKAIIDFHSKEKYDIYITGSNAFLLSSDLETLFTGRVFSIEVFPFSFKEYIQYYKYKDIYSAFSSYMVEGGMPGVYQYNDLMEKNDYLNGVINSIIYKDIVLKYNIIKKEMINKLADYMISNISQQLSSRNIEKELKKYFDKCSHVTLIKYMNYLCNSFAFYKIRRYDIQGKMYLSTNEKYYLADHSFKYSKLGSKNADYGQIMENIVAIELLRRGYEVYAGNLYNKEIDFIALKQSEKIYIQVSYNIDSKETRARELDPLYRIKDAYPKILISNTKMPMFDLEGVKIFDITDWLLNDK